MCIPTKPATSLIVSALMGTLIAALVAGTILTSAGLLGAVERWAAAARVAAVSRDVKL